MLQEKKTAPKIEAVCALDRSRTDTPLLALDFESSASTNSATRACKVYGLWFMV